MRHANLSKVLSEVYGAGEGIFSPVPILWAADRLADQQGVAVAKRELRSLNRQRQRLGLIPAVPEFGSRLF